MHQCQLLPSALLRSLHSVHDEEKPFELELSWVCEETNNEFSRVPADLVKEATDAAKAALADSDMCACRGYSSSASTCPWPRLVPDRHCPTFADSIEELCLPFAAGRTSGSAQSI